MSRKIYVTEHDKTKLTALIADLLHKDVDANSYVGQLENELEIAEVISDKTLPKDVVAMNSTALVCFDDMEEKVTLVYPNQADVVDNKISVLSPIGTAILGYKKGDSFNWEVNGKEVKITIKDVYTN